LRRNYTSVVARRVRIDGDYSTPPFEAGWAGEAVVFVQAEGDHPDLHLLAQVSPDGLAWVSRGPGVVLPAGEDIAELPLTVFGNWLRISITGASSSAPARILVHINAKG
jgi:hypothetical protein